MLDIISTIPDIFHTGLHTVSQQIMLNTLKRLGLEDYFENNINYKSIGTTISDSTNDSDEIKLKQNRIDVDIHTSSATGDQKWETTMSVHEYQQSLTHLSNRNHKKIFYEPIGQFAITEYEKPLTITMTCVMMFDDMVSAIGAIQRVSSLCSYGVLQQDLSFSYFLPPAIYIRLYELMLLTGRPKTEFIEYLSTWSGGRIDRTINRHNHNDKALSVQRNKAGVIVSLECDQGEPEPVGGTDNSPDMYSVTFTLITQLSMCNMMGLSYPIVVNNKLVPRSLVPIEDYELHSPKSITHPYFAIDRYRNLIKQEKPIVNDDPYRIPWYDNWYPESKGLAKRYEPFFITVVLLDDIENEDGVTNVNLETDFPKPLIPEVIETLKEQGTSSLMYDERINISVFTNDILVEPSTLTLTNGVELSIPNRNRTAIYRIVISADDFVRYKALPIRVINQDIIHKEG